MHHKRDACALTAPREVAGFKERLNRAKRAEVMWFDGGYSRGNVCQARAYHGFNGIEDRVVAGISGWIKAAGGE